MNTIAKRKHTNISPRCQGGLSLIELMISLTIGLILLAGITSLIVQQSSTRGELEKASREIENGRYAMQLLHDDIQLAGYYSEYSPASGVTYSVPADPCDIASGAGDSGWSATPTVPVPIYGFPGALTDPTATLAPTCGGLNNYKPYTAILVVRRTLTATVNPATVAAGATYPTYLQVSQCSTAATPFLLGTGGFSLLQKDCLTPANLRPYIVDVYYISSCSVCGTDTIPTLKMVQAGPTVTPSASIPLVEGIDNMQFDYGVDTNNDGAPDSYCTNPDLPATCTVPTPPAPPPSNWQNVMAVQVNLLARNNDSTPGYKDTTRTYRLSVISGVAVAGPFPDSFKRHAYSELVRAINPSGRRE